ncbi:MAG: condensation domain-containing protein, partial [Acidobacteria bacterium]|nr:condensation domain-containing protein [Acidobacteriota bacterium]
VQRHESFRTSFMMVAGEPVQRIHPEVEFAIEYFTTELCAQVRAFDLAKAALLRVLLRKETDKKHVMLVDMHHIITDGTSLGVLVEEFMALYKGEKPAALRLRYRDFSQWQNAQLQCGAVKQQEMYWTERLAGEIPILDLPYDFTRPGVQVFTGKTFMFTVAEVETRQLKSLALAERMSLFMLLTAVVNIFLAKISSQEHIIIGTSTAGRRHQDLQKIIGMFVNTLPLSNEPLGEKSIGSFLKEVKETILEAFENQDYQFEDLVDKIVVQRNTGRNPLFDVMFTLQNMDIAALEIPGLKLTPHPVETLTSRFDMTFLGVESEEKILFSLEYCTRLFTHETIKRLVRYFKAVIASVLSDRDQRIADIEIMTTEERQRLLIDFNAAETDYPRDKSIHELFVTQVEQSPDRIAIVGSLQQITFGQLNEQTNGLAGSLISRGVRAEDIVGIMADRSIDTLIGILGILKAGGAYLPIGPESPRERIDYMMKDSQAKILISIDEKKTDNCQCSIVNCQLSMSEPRASLHHANLAYILYTAGVSLIANRGVGIRCFHL